MLIASIVHIFVFSEKPYIKEGTQTPVLRTLKHVFSPQDIARDIKQSFFPSSRKKGKKDSHVELEEVPPSGPEESEDSPPDSPKGPPAQTPKTSLAGKAYIPQIDLV